MLNTDSIHMNVDDDNITTTATLTSLLNTKALLQANDNYHLHSNQHLWITYGWLGICITTILVIILIICSTIIHYTYRRKWRTLDILLAAILIQELPNAIILLSISSIKSTIIHLPRSWSYTSMYQHDDHSNWNFYEILLWLSTSNRFFQFAIITSLIVDRAFILKWPYQYRFSVRHSQIRFYMITLALISAVFGTFAVISHQNHQFDRSQSMSATITTTTTSSSFDFDRSWPTIETTEIKTTNIIDDNNRTTAAAENGTISTIAIKPTTTLLNQTSYYNSMIQFSYNPLIYDIYYSYFFIAIYGLLTLICFVAFLYVELNRPKNHNNNNDPMTKNSSSTTTATKNLQSISTLFATTSSSTSTSSSLSTSSPLPSRFSSFANLTNNNAGQQSNNNVSAAAVNHQSSINTGKTTLLPSFYYPNVKHHDQQQQQQQQQMKQMGNSLKINDSDDLFDNSNRSFHHHRQQQQQQQYNNGDSSMISLINSTNNNDNGDGHDPTSVHLNGNSGSTVLSATSPTTNGTTSTYTSMTTTTDNSIHRLIDNNIPHQHQQQQQQQKCAINTLCNNSNLIGFDNNGGSVGVSSMILSPLDVSINATAADSYSFLKQSFNNHGLSYQKSGSQLKLNILNDSFVDHHHHHHNRHQQQRINNSAFDLRWSSVIGPVLFCFAFNHGPFLVSVLNSNRIFKKKKKTFTVTNFQLFFPLYKISILNLKTLENKIYPF